MEQTVIQNYTAWVLSLNLQELMIYTMLLLTLILIPIRMIYSVNRFKRKRKLLKQGKYLEYSVLQSEDNANMIANSITQTAHQVSLSINNQPNAFSTVHQSW